MWSSAFTMFVFCYVCSNNKHANHPGASWCTKTWPSTTFQKQNSCPTLLQLSPWQSLQMKSFVCYADLACIAGNRYHFITRTVRHYWPRRVLPIGRCHPILRPVVKDPADFPLSWAKISNVAPSGFNVSDGIDGQTLTKLEVCRLKFISLAFRLQPLVQ